jgi:dihydroorotate dehydrogenase (NAD+) catalytic subunit
VKGVTTRQVHGNPTPRVAEVISGMLNAIGLQGPGVDKFLHDEHYLPGLRKRGATVIVNIWGRSLDEYRETAEKLEAESEGIAALEINVSCPNVKEGGISFSADPRKMAGVITAVRNVTKIPIITKLSPNGAIPVFAKAAEDAGSDMLSMINTIPAMAIDIETHRPKLANVSGGLSGPCVKPVGIKAVYDASKAVKIPIIGMGGIETWQDAAEYLIAGASAVAVGTATFTNPMAPIEVVRGLEQWLDRIGAKSVADVIGTVKL